MGFITAISRPGPNQGREHIRIVHRWNATHKVGHAVRLIAPDGKRLDTFTSTDAYLFGGHTAVVMVQGLTGPVELSKLTDFTTPPPAPEAA